MKKVSTLFLKGVIVLIGLAVLALCVFGLPSIAREAAEHFSKLVYLPSIIGVYAAVIPFFIVLHQSFKLLSLVNKNQAFSGLSVRALRNIKHCMVAMSILLAFGLLLVYRVADEDDAPGLMIIWMVIAGAPLVVATFAGVLEKLFQNAVDIKAEFDLTV